MEPPRPRRRRANRRPLSAALSTLVIDAIALYWTLLLVRAAVLLAAPAEQLEWLEPVRRVTGVAVAWLTWLPPLRATIAGELTLAEPVALGLSAVVAVVLLGVLAGWREESRWFPRSPLGWRRDDLSEQ